jgi:hypothetical protein
VVFFAVHETFDTARTCGEVVLAYIYKKKYRWLRVIRPSVFAGYGILVLRASSALCVHFLHELGVLGRSCVSIGRMRQGTDRRPVQFVPRVNVHL